MKTTLLLLFVALNVLTTGTGMPQTSSTSSETSSHVRRKAVQVSQNGTLVTIRSISPNTMHFYVFDVEGVMIYQAKMNKHEIRKTTLDQGKYSYSVFVNDESIEEGQIAIK